VLFGSLDFEDIEVYQFNVSALDGGSPQMFDVAQVEITILDLNDNSPVFYPSNEYVADVNEGDYTFNSSIVALVSNL
jgi:protocadherin Fat 4